MRSATFLLAHSVSQLSSWKTLSREYVMNTDRKFCNNSNQAGGKIRTYRDLRVWKDAMNLAEQVYLETELFPTSETFRLRRQIRDAASSIPANLAEGHRRYGDRAFLAFVGIAAGSHAELETRLELARRLGFIDPAASTRLATSIEQVGQQLTRLAYALSRRVRG
jgi:four helix bundle protein